MKLVFVRTAEEELVSQPPKGTLMVRRLFDMDASLWAWWPLALILRPAWLLRNWFLFVWYRRSRIELIAENFGLRGQLKIERMRLAVAMDMLERQGKIIRDNEQGDSEP